MEKEGKCRDWLTNELECLTWILVYNARFVICGITLYTSRCMTICLNFWKTMFVSTGIASHATEAWRRCYKFWLRCKRERENEDKLKGRQDKAEEVTIFMKHLMEIKKDVGMVRQLEKIRILKLKYYLSSN